jgi:hypothetical protein
MKQLLLTARVVWILPRFFAWLIGIFQLYLRAMLVWHCIPDLSLPREEKMNEFRDMVSRTPLVFELERLDAESYSIAEFIVGEDYK